MIGSERIFIGVGAVVSVLLQLFIAPYLGFGGAVPNFPLAYSLVIAVVRSSSFGCLMPFLLGLVFDFIGGGPVGGMALVLMVISVIASRCFQMVDNDSLFMALAILALGVLLTELAYGILMLAMGYQASLADILIYRVLPCFVYDLILGCILYFIVRRHAHPAGATRVELTQLR